MSVKAAQQSAALYYSDTKQLSYGQRFSAVLQRTCERGASGNHSKLLNLNEAKIKAYNIQPGVLAIFNM